MWDSKIVQLLSQHRRSGTPALPTALSQTQIIGLLRLCCNPNKPDDELSADIQSALKELEVQKEVLKAPGNYYCIAPPTLLASSESLIGLRFRGDRAYLKLAHTILKTGQPTTDEKLHSKKLANFDRAKDKLQKKGIRLLTLEDILNELPKPQKPPAFLLNGHEYILESDLEQFAQLQQYVPTYAEQNTRWISPDSKAFANESLLQLPDNRYLWVEQEKLYEIDQDTAILAMFYLDQRAHEPLRFVLTSSGQLNLQHVWLPYPHFKWLKQLVEPVQEKRRCYFVPKASRFLVRTLFQYLGCDYRD